MKPFLKLSKLQQRRRLQKLRTLSLLVPSSPKVNYRDIANLQYQPPEISDVTTETFANNIFHDVTYSPTDYIAAIEKEMEVVENANCDREPR